MVDFLFAIIELFSLGLKVETLKQIYVEIGAFWNEWVTLQTNFRWKGMSPPNHCWYKKTRVFLLPHSEDHIILSSFVWIKYQRETDRQMDGIAVANTAL